MTDGVWWFYLFYLPQFLNRNYGLDTHKAYIYILAVYVISSVGSIFGGTLSGFLMNHGFTVNFGPRKLTMLFMALLVLPLIAVPHMDTLFPANPWPASMLIALAAAAHQGWSANLFATSGDMFPASAVSTVRRHRAQPRRRRRSRLHLPRQTEPLAAPAHGLRRRRLLLPHLARHLHLLVPRLGAWRETALAA